MRAGVAAARAIGTRVASCARSSPGTLSFGGAARVDPGGINASALCVARFGCRGWCWGRRRARAGHGPWRGHRLGLGLLPLRCLLLGGLALDLLPVWSEHHNHVPAVLLGLGLDEPEFLDVVRQLLQEPEPELGPGLLAPAEHDRHLDL